MGISHLDHGFIPLSSEKHLEFQNMFDKNKPKQDFQFKTG